MSAITARVRPRSKQCLRRGRSDSGMEGAPLAGAGRVWRAWGAPIPSTVDPGRAEQTRPRGVKVVRTVARSTLTPLNHACSTVCGSTADGMGAGVSGGLRRDDAAMADESRRPLSELRPGETVQATITSHEHWGLMAELIGYEPVGASLDTFRRSGEPGVKRLAQNLPPVGATIDFVIGEVRPWHHEPWIWVDLTSAQ